MARETYFWAVRWMDHNGPERPTWTWQMRDGAPLMYPAEKAAKEAAGEVDDHLHAEAIPIEFPPLPEWA